MDQFHYINKKVRIKNNQTYLNILFYYRCLGWGLYRDCPKILGAILCRGESESIGGKKKLLFEPCLCSGGVGSQSWLCVPCGSMSISEHSRPGDNYKYNIKSIRIIIMNYNTII